jgi:hypothetical protein
MTTFDPKKNVLTYGPYSFMAFQPEQVDFDKETMNYIRFRSMFEMPNWDGVENEEEVIIIEDPNDRLDKIASRMWGVDRRYMYWIIAARNNLDLPDVQLYKGLTLKIPSKNWIDSKLLPQARKMSVR